MASTPKYNGSDGDRIDLVKARQWVKNYRISEPHGIHSHYFGRDVLDQILNQPGCQGIRVYFALDDRYQKTLLIAGVDNKGNTQLPVHPVITPGDFSIMDFSFPCPPDCPPGNDL